MKHIKQLNNLKQLSGAKANFSEADFTEKPTLFLFYNNQCLGCTGRAIPFAYKLQNEFACRLILIHSDFGRVSTEEEIKSIFTMTEIPFEIYRDENHQLYNHFNCEGTPHWVLFNQQAEVIQSIFGSQANAQNRLFYSLYQIFYEMR